ncbi:hypothetical protein FQR65_LT12574 [Abscondita terminalis]|nr:hypothetical protein FQR65_LT12574 [Abscondita terminalis]
MDLNTCPNVFTGIAGESFATFVNTLMAAQCALSSNEIYPDNYAPHLKNEDKFDFIVVGAGTAGSILANRLSENPKWKFSFPRGKVLGGTSSINGMGYIRGNRKNYDSWGIESWDYDSVLPHFKKFEALYGLEDERMGKNGEVKITKYQNSNPIRDALVEAYNELGYVEYSDERPLGYVDEYNNIYNGTRYGAAKAFLQPLKDRKNAYLVVNAQVSRVLLGSDLSAIGVEVRIDDKILTVKATKEIILSAGAINSPQILMNSGIGPKEHLEELNIPVVKDLPVGENLQDYVFFMGLMVNVGEKTLPKKTSSDLLDEWHEYLMYKTGTLSMTGIDNFLAYVNTKNDSLYPNLEIYYVPIHKNDPYSAFKTVQNVFNLPPEVAEVQNENIKKSNTIILIPSISYTKSIGKVLLANKDPFSKPKIFSNYFTDEDLQVLLDGVRFLQKLTLTKAFAVHKPEFVNLNIEKCKGIEYNTDDYWRCAIKNITNTVYHLAGTCKMGRENDLKAVVDPRLRVKGIKNLRVVDASIMPRMITCNIHAPVMMIGQKASDMIKEDWLSRHE